MHRILPEGASRTGHTTQAEVQAEKESAIQRLEEELKLQVERGERALEDARTNFLREKKASITTAVSSAVRRRTAELETAKEEVLASLRSKLEVTEAPCCAIGSMKLTRRKRMAKHSCFVIRYTHC